jgi:hypothetical protein
MNREIYGLWYKHPSNLITTPQMALMTRKEGIEAYGLYMHFADTLHSVGGFLKYDFNDICLMLGYTKKNIKAKLGRVLNDYDLFDFDEDKDGIEIISLQRLRDDIEALAKHKINGSKGGRKRAENYRNKQEEEEEEEEEEEQEEIIRGNEAVKEEVKEHQSIKLPSWFSEQSTQRQKESVRHMISEGKFNEKGLLGEKMKQMMIEHINGKMR